MMLRPANLTTQLALVMALAVLTAAAVQLAVLLVERNRTGMIEASGPAITRFADLSSEAMGLRISSLPDAQTSSFRRRGARILIAEQNFIQIRNLSRQGQLERRLQRAMADLGHPDVRVMAATRIIDLSETSGPDMRPFGEGGPPLPRYLNRARNENRKFREIVLANEIAPGRWISGAFIAPLPPNDEFGRLFLGALIAVGFVLGAAIWMSARLVRPLSDLATAAGRLGNASSPQPLAVRGPKEIRRTLSAFNNMSGRVSHLLREKDIMLGALGHDLRTPLASLRIRVENMEPPTEREKAIHTIEETTRLLESILDFARTGQTDNNFERVDLKLLTDALVQEYRERGNDVTATSDADAFVLITNPDLMRRLLRNLIDNASQHGDTITVDLRHESGAATIVVSDDGPGIPDDQIAQVKQPFFRGETSRNRAHGGAGLGLALADMIARALDAELILTNRSPHGLQAAITFTVPAD